MEDENRGTVVDMANSGGLSGVIMDENQDEQALVMKRAFAVNRLLSLGRAVRNGTLMDFLKTYRGERIILNFPDSRLVYMVLCLPEEICISECDVNALCTLNTQLGQLSIVGYLDGFHDDPSRQITGKRVFMMTQTAAVYIYDASPYGGLYRLSRSILGFARRGLFRYDCIYNYPYMPNLFCVKNGQGSLPMTIRDLKKCVGLACSLLCPEGFNFIFGFPDEGADDTALLSEEQSSFCSHAQLLVFGHFGLENGDASTRVAVFVGESTSVYAFHRNSLRLLRLAESLPMFYRIGIRRYFSNYRAVGSRLGDNCLFLDPI
ncbi:b25.2 [Murid betaherpesvirus 8]|uniref:B25.2 n=1 Tax=Rat cytomegalovirus (isolate England) TaxID=1261657 RepID=A0A0E3SY56_RCMVE|nr:b25.2 [Murid betaherpesvirus 8]WPH24942.1 b25.2 [Murid betaherpesvirus 8]WPH25076.1 b25.2 [Murid betaherpesvirus 8]